MTLPPLSKVLRWGATLALGAAGGLLASRIGAPLPWMLGALGATAALAMLRVPVLGAPPSFPMRLRLVFIPVIGVLIGASATPALLAEAPNWWPALIATPLFVAAAHAVNYAIMRRVGGLDRPTAFFAGMPGGLIESIELGERAGAELRALTVLQFARIAITVTAIPLVFSLIEGRAVGSAAGESFGAHAPLTPWDILALTVCGVAGLLVAQRLHVPAGQITGPILFSAVAHLAGLTAAAPPPWLAATAQVVIGVSLGVRFVGVDGAALRRWFALSGLSVAAMLAIGAVISGVLAAAEVAPFAAGLLGLAPGGVVEMGLIALSLSASPLYVTVLHIVRILATVGLAAWAWRRLSARAE